MSTTVDIITETRDDVIKVPIQAVTVRPKEKLKKEPGVEEQAEESSGGEEKTPSDKKPEMTEVVFLVDGNIVVSKEVKLDISDDTHYAILSGVEEGDEVITGPFRVLSRTLKDGDLIEYEKKEKEVQDADRGN
jgi:HlyD family secretion protein